MVRTAKNLTREHGANLIFLIDTKCLANSLGKLCFEMGFKLCVGVDAVGSVGTFGQRGMGLMWLLC